MKALGTLWYVIVAVRLAFGRRFIFQTEVVAIQHLFYIRHSVKGFEPCRVRRFSKKCFQFGNLFLRVMCGECDHGGDRV